MKDENIVSNEDVFVQEYEELMQSSKDSFVVPVQWTDEGDSIQQFSLYEDYTPVKTSGDTSPNIQ